MTAQQLREVPSINFSSFAAGSECSPVLRPLNPGDGEGVRVLCEECFPLSYPDSWYRHILSEEVFSLGAFSSAGDLLGMIIGELQPLDRLEGEVGVVLERSTPDTQALYIVSLGVHSEYRQRGLGSLLLRSLLSHTSHHPHCQAVYLHVLVTNTSAIEFYRRLGFQELLTIPDYYFIRNKPADGLLFCCYVNGGQEFVGGVRSYLRRYITETALCRVLTQLWTYVCRVMRTTLQRNKFYSFYTC